MKGELLHRDKSGPFWVTRVQSPRPSEPPWSGCWPSPEAPYPLSLTLFTATAVTSKFHEFHNHVPASGASSPASLGIALTSFREALHKALSILLESSSFLLLFHKKIFITLLPSAPKCKLHRRRDFVRSLHCPAQHLLHASNIVHYRIWVVGIIAVVQFLPILFT